MNRYASPIETREAAVGGGLFLTFFGAFWVLATLAQNPSSLNTPLFALVAGVTLALLATCVLLRRSKRRTPATADPEAKALKKATFRRFGAVVAVEAVAIGLANALLAAHHAEFIAPAVGLVVGVHFFPLAKLFREPIYILTGGFMTLLSGVATIALLAGVTLGAPYDWSVLVGTSSALALWITAGSVLAAQFRAANKPGRRVPDREQGAYGQRDAEDHADRTARRIDFLDGTSSQRSGAAPAARHALPDLTLHYGATNGT